MKIEIKVPQAGESVTEAMISEWFKEDGEAVAKDEALLELETDKANMELVADAAGRLHVTVAAGEVVTVGQVIGHIDTDAAGEGDDAASADEDKTAAPAKNKDDDTAEEKGEDKAEKADDAPAKDAEKELPLAPSVRRIVTEEQLDPATIGGTGKDGRITKEDALAAARGKTAPAQAAPAPKPRPTPDRGKVVEMHPGDTGGTRTVPMSMMRRRIAKNLVEAQQTAAILTTFNEVDMSAVMALRTTYQDIFVKKHGLKLGFMSFFVKACVEALKEIPEINAQIDGTNIIYQDFYDIGVAVGSDKGLVVPVVRGADAMSFAEVERTIGDFGNRARQNKIKLEELTGGTFTISNGGIYGSLLSTPILNAPQSAILGMHKIEKRAVVVDDQVVVRPMMYLALSYDHRIVDGKGAVTFLVKVKECLEDPARMLLEI